MRENPFINPALFDQQAGSTNTNLDPQSINAQNYISGLDQFHTPYTHYAKPRQPDNWYQSVPHQDMQPYPWQAKGQTEPYAGYGYSGYSEPLHMPVDSSPNHINSDPFQPLPADGQQMSSNQQPHTNYYPQGATPKQMSNLLTQFQNPEGQLDVDKMLNTVGQLANTYHQVAPIVKQVSSLIKTFRA